MKGEEKKKRKKAAIICVGFADADVSKTCRLHILDTTQNCSHIADSNFRPRKLLVELKE